MKLVITVKGVPTEGEVFEAPAARNVIKYFNDLRDAKVFGDPKFIEMRFVFNGEPVEPKG